MTGWLLEDGTFEECNEGCHTQKLMKLLGNLEQNNFTEIVIIAIRRKWIAISDNTLIVSYHGNRIDMLTNEQKQFIENNNIEII